MSLIKLVESYKKKMSAENYKTFLYFCKTSVDLYTENTSNKKNKDLAELQIIHLAEIYLK